MIWPMPYSIVIKEPVAMFDLRPRKRSRAVRRANRYGKQEFWSKYKGELSPKQMREAGL